MQKLLIIAIFFSFSFTKQERDLLLYQDSDGTLVNYKSYVVCFDDSLRYTKWASYLLTNEMLEADPFKRRDNFRPDKSIKNCPQLKDYRKSGFDRGHLVNSMDMRFDSISQSESFYLTNMAPQVPSFNRGIWKNLESETRKWVKTHGKLYIITGSILKDSIRYIGSGVPVPSHFYKIIYDPQRVQAIAFIMKNNPETPPLKKYAVTIDRVEEETKIDFLHILEDHIENNIESSIDTTWFY